MTRRSTAFAVVAAGVLAMSGARAATVTTDDFTVPTTAALVTLCTAPDTDPLYTAARNFCHGFAVGTYRAVAAEEAASRSKHKMFCMGDAAPTRDQAVAAFVQWANGRPKTLESSPTDGITEYLAATYPCK
nr:Rap1a/Tai family immunity protein [uncultured Rhodopila sp.]